MDASRAQALQRELQAEVEVFRQMQSGAWGHWSSLIAWHSVQRLTSPHPLPVRACRGAAEPPVAAADAAAAARERDGAAGAPSSDRRRGGDRSGGDRAGCRQACLPGLSLPAACLPACLRTAAANTAGPTHTLPLRPSLPTRRTAGAEAAGGGCQCVQDDWAGAGAPRHAGGAQQRGQAPGVHRRWVGGWAAVAGWQ